MIGEVKIDDGELVADVEAVNEAEALGIALQIVATESKARG